jgi:hypothetical protein
MTNQLGGFTAFVQLQKVDVAKREVWGVAAVEQPDGAREIMDYDKSLPNFLNWSRDMYKASGGKSQGNLRAMHRDVAAGKLIHFEPRDATKDFYIGTKIVDDNEWKKVLEGVYTGFSVGGSYGAKWEDAVMKGYTRYEAKPVEISLVDKPCMPGATFQVIKADGQVEMRKLATAEDAGDLAKGDYEGHPFRGNQYEDAEGGGDGVPDRVTEAAGTEAEFNASEKAKKEKREEDRRRREEALQETRAKAREKFVNSTPPEKSKSKFPDRVSAAMGMTEEEFNTLDEMGYVEDWGVSKKGMSELQSMRAERKAKAGGSDFMSTLNDADKKALQSTRALKTSGFKPMNDADARSISSEAAEIINSQRGSGYTVMGSSFSGFDYEGDQPKALTFPGVSFGSGESKKKLKQGAAILEEYGFKVRIIDDVNYKGIVVSKSLPLTTLIKGAGMKPAELLEKLTASSDPAMQALADQLTKAFPPAKKEKDEESETDDASESAKSGDKKQDPKAKEKAKKNPFSSGDEEADPNAEDSAEGEDGDPEAEGMTEEGEEGAEAVEQPAEATPEQTEAIRAVVIQLLEELGFVQEQGGEMGAPKAVKFLTPGDLQKRLKDREDALQKAYGAISDRQRELTEDLAKVADVVNTMAKNGGPAPVVRDLGTLTAGAAAEMQQESLIKGMIDSTNDPVVKQALQNQLTTLAIKKVQRSTNTNQ